MRVSVIILLVLVIGVAAYSPRKSEKKLTNAQIVEMLRNGEAVEINGKQTTLEEIEAEAGYDADAPNKKKSQSKKNEEKLKKQKEKEKIQNGDDDEPIVRELSAREFFEIGRMHRIEKLKEKASQIPESNVEEKLKNKKELEELESENEEENDDDAVYEACGATSKANRDDELCHCDQDEIDCSATVLDADDPKLRTADLQIMKKDFVPIIANFSVNGITRLESKKILPGFASKVSVLDFSHNAIRFIETSAFSDFKNLSRLNLASNRLGQIKKKWFDGIEDTLHRLDLSENKITSIPDNVFEELTELKKLILDGNPIKEWRKEMFKGLDKLEQLSLDNCKIEELPGDLFDNLPNLQGVSLRSNPLEEIPRVLFNRKSLKIVDLSETSLSEIRSNAFENDNNMEEIIMEEMKYLTSIRGCAFCGLTNLKSLVLADNPKLFEIHENAFGFISSEPGKKAASLTTLHIQNGNISTLSEQMLDFGKIESLKVAGNPWNCTCETAFLLDSKRFTFKEDSTFPKCNTPVALKDRSLATVHDYEACAKVRKERRSGRLSTVLGLVFLVVCVVIGVYYGVTSGALNRMFRRVQDIPEVSYSGLNNRDVESMISENDFEPRAAEV